MDNAAAHHKITNARLSVTHTAAGCTMAAHAPRHITSPHCRCQQKSAAQGPERVQAWWMVSVRTHSPNPGPNQGRTQLTPLSQSGAYPAPPANTRPTHLPASYISASVTQGLPS